MFKKLLKKIVSPFKKLSKTIKTKVEKVIVKKVAKSVFKNEKIEAVLERFRIVMQIPEVAKVMDKLLKVLEEKVKKTDTAIDDALLDKLKEAIGM